MDSPLSSYLKANGGMERKVVIELLPREFERDEGPFGSSVVKVTFDRLRVWADKGLLDTFEKIPGVMLASQDKSVSVCYAVSIDPRYNTEWVMAEIRAAAELYEPTVPSPSEWVPHFTVDNGQNS